MRSNLKLSIPTTVRRCLARPRRPLVPVAVCKDGIRSRHDAERERSFLSSLRVENEICIRSFLLYQRRMETSKVKALGVID
jgi:hypothetical protein